METNSIPEHVTVDTQQVRIAGRDALALLQRLSTKYEEVQLVPVPEGEGSAGSLSFDIWLGGISTAHELVLSVDGTWTVLTHIEV